MAMKYPKLKFHKLMKLGKLEQDSSKVLYKMQRSAMN